MIGEPYAILSDSPKSAKYSCIHVKNISNNDLNYQYSPEKECSSSPKMFVIEGNIGVGKTTLARALSKLLGCRPFLEPALENPFLERFYEKPHKYAMKLQMWIFRQRYRTYLEAVKHMDETRKGVVLDRSVFSDYVFARVGRNQGFISQEDFDKYLSLRERILKSLPKPYCIIYLAASPEQCSERLLKRGRECESSIPLDYLRSLDKEYSSLLKSFDADGTNVARFDWSRFREADEVVRRATAIQKWTPWTLSDYQNAYEEEKDLMFQLNQASEDDVKRTD